MEYSKFNFVLTPSNPAAKLGFQTWIDDQCIFQIDHVDRIIEISGDLPSDDVAAEHTLKFLLHGKTVRHTQLDQSGAIIQDAVLIISNLSFNSIALGNLTNRLCKYTHNFNGTSDTVIEPFHGTLGCNGTAELKFQTPIYPWFLQNM